MTKRKEYPGWEWRDKVQVGDVLKTPSGDLRVVRKVHLYPDGDKLGRDGTLRTVVLAIRRCSWTGRGDTWVNRVDLRQRGFQPTGIKYEVLVTDVDKLTCCEGKMLP